MRVKLIQDLNHAQNQLPAGSVIDVDDAYANSIIGKGIAGVYDDAAVKAEADLVTKRAQELTIEAKAVKHGTCAGVKTMNFLGKAIKALVEGKATGMSGAATLAGTEATEVLGVIGNKSQLWDKVRKVPISGNLNVIYSKGNSGSPTPLPVVAGVTEGTAGATTVPMGNYEAIPQKYFATVAVTNELLEDVPALEAFVIEELQGELGNQLDQGILSGAFGSNTGLKGVIDDANAVQADFADFTSPTLSELTNMVSKVNPNLHGDCMWVVSPAFWSACEAELMTADNVAQQLIKTGKVKELLGFPVVVSFGAPATAPALFGDFSKYLIGQRKEITIQRDDSVLFDTDETMIRIRVRLCGGLAAGVRVINGTSYGSIAYAGLTGS